MNIYAISDLHLSIVNPKPMNVFGPNWIDHWDKIRSNWFAKINAEDIVLIPGDISWAMSLPDALEDIKQLALLPGRKIILRGNHDYWWNSISKLRQSLPEGILAVQNDSVLMEDFVIAGSRGWSCTGSADNSAEDDRIYRREVLRMELSLQSAERMMREGSRLIVMTHFPPFNERQDQSEMMSLFETYRVDTVIYGHLHGVDRHGVFQGDLNGVHYRLVSCDFLNFDPLRIY